MGDLAAAVRGRTVVVTGASSGIGADVARQLGAAGATVVLAARSADKLEKVALEVEAAGGVAHCCPVDLADRDGVAAFIEGVLSRHGSVDVLVSNAALSIRRSLALSYERLSDYERTARVNHLAGVQLVLGFLPGMRSNHRGQVVNVSSIGLHTRAPRFSAYLSSKAAFEAFCDAAQMETLVEGVRFTNVYLPLVRTPMLDPTPLYRRLPALTPEVAASRVCRAIADRPRRVESGLGRVARVAMAVAPRGVERVLNAGYRRSEDSPAATRPPAS